MATPIDFGDARAELQAALGASALADGSDFARLLATGPDALGLLQRLSTGDVAELQPGTGAATVLTTSKGRIVERLFVHHLGAPGVLLVGGAASASRVLEHIGRYTFADDTGLTDAGETLCQWRLIGPKAAAAAEACGLEPPARCAVTTARLAGVDVHVLGQDGLTSEGFSVVGPADAAGKLRQELERAVCEVGGRAAGSHAVESWRVLGRIPASGHELTEDHNPLEADLWDAVDFDKGCYVGQEVVARLRTYDRVSRALVGLAFATEGADLPPTRTSLLLDGREIGILTSVVLPPDRPAAVGLGYVKRRDLKPEMEVSVGTATDAPVARVIAPEPT